MPNQRISELTAVTSPVSGDVLPIVNAGSTKKIAVGNLVGVRKDLSSNNLFSIEGDKNFSCNNVFIGKGLASSFNTSSFNNENVQNTVISNFSLSAVNRANRNILIGNYLMKDACACIEGGDPTNFSAPAFSKNIVFGNCSFKQPLNKYLVAYDACGNTTCSIASNYNIVIGNNSLNGKKIENNIVIGNGTGPNLGGTESGPNNPFTCAYRDTSNVLIGNNSGVNLCGGTGSSRACSNVFIGDLVGNQNVFGQDNIAIGTCAMRRDPVFNRRGGCVSNKNVMIGSCTGSMMLSGSSNNIFLGHKAGGYMRYGACCEGSFISYNFSSLANRNVALGSCAMGYAGGLSARPTIEDNIAIGYKSLMRNCGCRNISIGSFSNHRKS